MPSVLLKSCEPFHFVGIGGIGMSALAETLHLNGIAVQGSDQSDNANTQRLAALGVPTYVGHDPSNIGNARTLVWSTAVKDTNPEMSAARHNGMRILHRSEILRSLTALKNSIAVTGTHGKTTTTTLFASVCTAGGLDPTVINGGIMNSYGSNVRVGQGNWIVAEADESDGTFNRLTPTIAVATNLDPEHLDHYGDFGSLQAAFREFLRSVPYWGQRIVCTDCSNLRQLSMSFSETASAALAPIVTYGTTDDAMVKIHSVEPTKLGMKFSISCRDLPGAAAFDQQEFELSAPGSHNALNCGAVIAFAASTQLVSIEAIKDAFANYSGVLRRFTAAGSWNGAQIIDDYAHHPREIQCVIEAARSRCSGRVHVIFQPHRFTRLNDLWDGFVTSLSQADSLALAPVYSAGEDPIEGVNSETLIEAIKQTSPIDVVTAHDPLSAANHVNNIASHGDLVLFLGAGSISQWAGMVQDTLEKNSGTHASVSAANEDDNSASVANLRTA